MAAPNLSRFRRAAFAVKTEATYGTDPGVTTSTNIIPAMNVSVAIEQEQFRDERQGGNLDNRPDIPGIRTARISGEALLRGSTGLPEWDPLIKSLGAETTGVGAGVTIYTVPGATSTSIGQSAAAALAVDNGPTIRVLGGFGTGSIRCRVGEPAVLQFDLTGQSATSTGDGLIAQVPTGVTPPTFKDAALTYGTSTTYTPRVAELTFDLGNSVQYIYDANNVGGVIGSVIEGRRPEVSFTVETVPASEYDWYSEMFSPSNNGLGNLLTWRVGTATGNTVTFTLPRVQITNIEQANRNGVRVFNLTGKANSASSAGEWIIRAS